jgi:Kelch motif
VSGCAAVRRLALTCVAAIAVVLVGGCSSERPTSADRARLASGRAAAGRPAGLQARRLGRLPASVQLPAAARLPRGGVLLAGGLSAAGTSLPTIVAVRGGRAQQAGSLPTALHDAAAARIDGGVYFFGGGSSGSSAEILRIGAGQAPARAGSLPAPASDVAAASIGGTAYVVGGYTGSRPLSSIVAFRPGSRARVVGTLPSPVRYAAVAALGGRVLKGKSRWRKPQAAAFSSVTRWPRRSSWATRRLA